jgi:hypothetical protein
MKSLKTGRRPWTAAARPRAADARSDADPPAAEPRLAMSWVWLLSARRRHAALRRLACSWTQATRRPRAARAAVAAGCAEVLCLGWTHQHHRWTEFGAEMTPSWTGCRWRWSVCRDDPFAAEAAVHSVWLAPWANCAAAEPVRSLLVLKERCAVTKVAKAAAAAEAVDKYNSVRSVRRHGRAARRRQRRIPVVSANILHNKYRLLVMCAISWTRSKYFTC